MVVPKVDDRGKSYSSMVRTTKKSEWLSKIGRNDLTDTPWNEKEVRTKEGLCDVLLGVLIACIIG